MLSGTPASCRLIQYARVLVVVAIQTEQFPIAAVRWVVIVIVVFVVYRQLAQAHARKLATASPANPWKQFERLLTIIGFTLVTLLARFSDNAIEPGMIRIRVSGHVGQHSRKPLIAVVSSIHPSGIEKYAVFAIIIKDMAQQPGLKESQKTGSVRHIAIP